MWKQLGRKLRHGCYPPRTRGPFGVWKTALEYLGLSEPAPLVLCDLRGQQCNVKHATKSKFMSFLIHASRIALLRQAGTTRRHLRDAEASDVPVSTYWVHRNFPFRRELVQIITDGVWTQHVKSKIQGDVSEICSMRDSGHRETPEHIWRFCPRWEIHRKWPRSLDEEWDTFTPASRNCILCPEAATRKTKAAWPEVQLACANTLHHRYAAVSSAEHLPEQPVEPQRAEPGETPTHPLVFGVSYMLMTRKHPWLFTRKQWHRLTHFMSTLREPLAPLEGARMPSLAELYLSYIAQNGRHAFHDGLPTECRGGELTSQKAAFAMALRSFAEITGVDDFLHSEGMRAPMCPWIGQFSIGQTPLLKRRVCLPNGGEVQALLMQAKEAIAQMLLSDRNETYGLWKRWRPSLIHSQLCDGGDLPDTPLVALPLTRLARGAPVWKHQCREHQSNWTKLQKHPALEVFVHGVSMSSLVLEHGFLSRSDLKSLCTSQRRLIQRAMNLIASNDRAIAAHTHIAASATSLRSSCVACGDVGGIVFKTSWFRARCFQRVTSSQVAEANQVLQQQIEAAKERATFATLLKRSLA